MAKRRQAAAPKAPAAKATAGVGGTNCFILGTLATSATMNLECAKKDFVGMRLAEAAEGVARARRDIGIMAETIRARGFEKLVRRVEKDAAVLEIELKGLSTRPRRTRTPERYLLGFAKVLGRHNQIALRIAGEHCGVPLPETATVRAKGPRGA